MDLSLIRTDTITWQRTRLCAVPLSSGVDRARSCVRVAGARFSVTYFGRFFPLQLLSLLPYSLSLSLSLSFSHPSDPLRRMLNERAE